MDLKVVYMIQIPQTPKIFLTPILTQPPEKPQKYS